ncbi:MTH1187 family thiamine-binding protein [bacterium]|nr:MTH1187 family thiamine-binding protein [bacterium]
MNTNARMEISVYPLGTCSPGISREVSPVLEVLDSCGLPHEVSVMGTIVEGSPDDLFNLARRLHDVVFSDTVRRVVTIIRIDERR